MPTSNHHHKTSAPLRLNPALCASAFSRLGWAVGALVLLWGTIHWALS